MRDGLTRQGVDVVAMLADGADAAGTIVAEQPDLVFLEEQLPSVSGIELVERVQTLSARSILGVQVRDSDHVSRFADAGVQAVFTRRVPPAYVVEQLVRCLVDSRPVSLT